MIGWARLDSTDVSEKRSTRATAPGERRSAPRPLLEILEHELGHAYGLNHSGLTCAAPGPSVMVQGEGKFACGGTPPWAEDVNGVTDRYN